MGTFSRAVPQRGKSVLVGEGDRLGAVACVNLGEQVVDVAFDGAFADDELFRDWCGSAATYVIVPPLEVGVGAGRLEACPVADFGDEFADLVVAELRGFGV